MKKNNLFFFTICLMLFISFPVASAKIKFNGVISENGHKYAICDIKSGENVIKYGQPIGHAICDIKSGEHVHTHNIKTNLSDKLEYSYNFTWKGSRLPPGLRNSTAT